ncbi:hypothetical protein SLS62_002835 [Diatrype stigma]|uniref:SprT-like domain-containing protein n=1 Tax=Diatrype stigma TaxID=117547 RepID=A0AAN9UW51_9PEZI
MSPNQDKYTQMHAYGVQDLVESVVRSCCLDDQTKLTAIQQQARAVFLDSYLSYPEDITRDQLLVLMHHLDIIFYAGALTQRDTERVVFKILSYDAWSWNRVHWRHQEPEYLAYTKYNVVPKTKVAIIAMTRVFGGRRFNKKQMVDILAHEMVHAFLSLYWDWCPSEKEATLQGGPNTHGQTFKRMIDEIHGTIGLWHPSLEGMGKDHDIQEPLPGRWLTRTNMGFAVVAAIQRGLRTVIRWHEDAMVPRPVEEVLPFTNPANNATQEVPKCSGC